MHLILIFAVVAKAPYNYQHHHDLQHFSSIFLHLSFPRKNMASLRISRQLSSSNTLFLYYMHEQRVMTLLWWDKKNTACDVLNTICQTNMANHKYRNENQWEEAGDMIIIIHKRRGVTEAWNPPYKFYLNTKNVHIYNVHINFVSLFCICLVKENEKWEFATFMEPLIHKRQEHNVFIPPLIQ